MNFTNMAHPWWANPEQGYWKCNKCNYFSIWFKDSMFYGCSHRDRHTALQVTHTMIYNFK